ncbi:MAG: helix-turn-helix transcriptional regulator [Novosphingobium sp.]|nr:helix-turn-helix transcriptional regulator [Novosphingobium sp.]
MSCKMVPVKKAIANWRNDPAFLEAYDALEDEFSLASQIINARARAGLTQCELAERMGTSQSSVARLESGRCLPSVATLEKLAAATGSKLRIALESS